MGKASMTYKELRFVISDELTTEAYVAIQAEGDCPLGVQGWHHKTFPASISVRDILDGFVDESPVLWPLEAPQEGKTDE